MTPMEVMTNGHIEVAKELGIEVSKEEAEHISKHDSQLSTCLFDGIGGYVVYKTSKSITGTIHILTKLYIPKLMRGNGRASILLDMCETPLITSDNLKVIRS